MAAALQVSLIKGKDWGDWNTTEIVEYDWEGNKVLGVVLEFGD